MRVLIYNSHADFYAEQLTKVAPHVTFLIAKTLEEAISIGTDAQAVIGLAPALKPPLIQAMPHLEWIQALTTGVDNLMGLSGVAITNCNGIHGPQMSEMAIMLMLASCRNFDHVLDNQRKSEWVRWPQPLLAGKTACLVGVGAIAEHLAVVLNALGMTVTGVSGRSEVPGFARLYTRDRLETGLAEADFVLVLSPYTPQTHHIIDAAAIAGMKPSAHLVNLSRGGCLDEDALIAALNSGAIAGAACDVFASEPLPANSPLWTLPNLIITPHLGGYSDVYHKQALPIVTQNITDYAQGGVDALKGRIDT